MADYRYPFKKFIIKSPCGFMKYIAGKEVYIVTGTIEAVRMQPGEYHPVIICNQHFNRYIEEGDIASEFADMEAHIQDYVDNYDTIEEERDLKLNNAAAWKKEQLIINGVDLTDDVERKIWQNRQDLLTNAEKDTLIDEWETS